MSDTTSDSLDLATVRETSPFAYAGLLEEQYQANHDAKLAYLEYVARQVDPVYDWAEFGVETGISTRHLLRYLPARVNFYLFDSFLGLPEPWIIGSQEDPDPDVQHEGSRFGWHHGAGSFRTLEKPTFTDKRAVVVEGWFSDTLPTWSAGYPGTQLALVHIDCDLYSSAKTVYENIGHLIKPGTIIIFDEFTTNHDKKAFFEFIQATDYHFEYLAAVRGAFHVSVRIVE